MPAPLAKPADGDTDRSPQLLAIIWSQGGISFVILCLRIYVRFVIKSLGLDDYSMIAGWMLYLMALVFATLTAKNGGGRHLYHLKPPEIEKVLKWNWVTQPFGMMAQPFCKASIGILILRIIGPNTLWRKRFIWANIFLFFALSIAASILNFLQCNPPRALWKEVPGSKCWDPKAQPDFAAAIGAYSASLDFCLAALPVTIFWDMSLTPSKKVGLCLLLGLGTFAGISAAVKTANLHELAFRLDITWATFSLYAWGSTETCLLIICGSIPAIKPLYERMMQGKPMVSIKGPPYNSGHSRPSNGGLRRYFGRPSYLRESTAIKSGYSEASDERHFTSLSTLTVTERTFDVELDNRSLTAQSSPHTGTIYHRQGEVN